MRPMGRFAYLVMSFLLSFRGELLWAEEAQPSPAQQYNRRVFLFTFINEQNDKRTQYLSVSIPEAFSNPLIKTGNFVVLNRKSVERYAETLGITMTDLWNEANAVRLGRAVGADVVLVGKFVTTEKSVVVHVKAVDVQAGALSVEDQAEITTDTTMFNEIDALAKRMSGPMAEKMKPMTAPPPPAEVVLDEEQIKEHVQLIEEKKAAENPAQSTRDTSKVGLSPLLFLTQGEVSGIIPSGFGVLANYEHSVGQIPFLKGAAKYVHALRVEAGFLQIKKEEVGERIIPFYAGPVWYYQPFSRREGGFFISPVAGVALISITSPAYSASAATAAVNLMAGYEYAWHDLRFSAAFRYAYFFDRDAAYALQGLGFSIGVGYKMF